MAENELIGGYIDNVAIKDEENDGLTNMAFVQGDADNTGHISVLVPSNRKRKINVSNDAQLSTQISTDEVFTMSLLYLLFKRNIPIMCSFNNRIRCHAIR